MTRISRGYLIQAMAWVFILQAYLVVGAGVILAETTTTRTSVTIKSKERNTIITSDGKRFLITDSTKTFDVKGRQMVEANNVPVPCKAVIYYQPTMNGDPVALKIVVRRIIPVPSTSLPPTTPQ